jgi:hypothetical protein
MPAQTPRRLMAALAAALLATLAPAAAHPAADGGYSRDHVDGGLVFSLDIHGHLPIAGREARVDLTLREYETGAHVEDATLQAFLVRDDGADDAARTAIPLEPRDVGHTSGLVTFPADGDWRVVVEAANASARAWFPVTAYREGSGVFYDWSPQADRWFHLHLESRLAFIVRDMETGGPVAPPSEGAVIVVERWDDARAERLWSTTVAALPGVAPGEIAATYRFPEAGAYELRIATPGLGETDRPGWRVLASAVDDVEEVEVETEGGPPRGVPTSPLATLVALATTARLLGARRRCPSAAGP